MKILFLLSQRPDSTGSGYYVQAMMTEANKAGHSCFLVSGMTGCEKSHTEKFPFADHSFVYFEGEDLAFPMPGMSDIMPYKSTCFKDMSAAEIDSYEACLKTKIAEAAEVFKPDIIHSNHLWLMSAVAREVLPDIPMITSCHGSDLRQLENCVHLRDRVVPACRKINGIIALGESQKKEIMRLYGIAEEKIFVVGSGFNEAVFCNAEKEPMPPVTLLYAGKLSFAKGVPWLLKSLSLSIEHQLPFHLYLAGSGTGNDYKICCRLAEKMKHHVTLCGALNQKQLAALMKKAHIFILPSFFEGLPLVIFEALASGCKIITTALPGTKEIAAKLSDERNPSEHGLSESGKSELIRFIDLPVLETVDSPFESDMPMLIEKLSVIIKEEIEKSLLPTAQKSGAKPSNIEKGLAKYTWKGIFKKIESIYIRHQSE